MHPVWSPNQIVSRFVAANISRAQGLKSSLVYNISNDDCNSRQECIAFDRPSAWRSEAMHLSGCASLCWYNLRLFMWFCKHTSQLVETLLGKLSRMLIQNTVIASYIKYDKSTSTVFVKITFGSEESRAKAVYFLHRVHRVYLWVLTADAVYEPSFQHIPSLFAC